MQGYVALASFLFFVWLFFFSYLFLFFILSFFVFFIRCCLFFRYCFIVCFSTTSTTSLGSFFSNCRLHQVQKLKHSQMHPVKLEHKTIFQDAAWC